jgi:hypothetical protein
LLHHARLPTSLVAAGFRCPACAHKKGWPHGGNPFTFECAAGKQASITAATQETPSGLSRRIRFPFQSLGVALKHATYNMLIQPEAPA